MIRETSGRIWTSGLAFLALAVASGAAQAQHSNATQGSEPNKYITIVAGHAVQHQKVPNGSLSTAFPTEEISVSHTVSYADLDLRNPSGVSELKDRVKQAAQTACQELDRLSPGTNQAYGGDPSVETDSRTCIQRAEDSSRKDVDRVVRLAEGR